MLTFDLVRFPLCGVGLPHDEAPAAAMQFGNRHIRLMLDGIARRDRRHLAIGIPIFRDKTVKVREPIAPDDINAVHSRGTGVLSLPACHSRFSPSADADSCACADPEHA